MWPRRIPSLDEMHHSRPPKILTSSAWFNPLEAAVVRCFAWRNMRRCAESFLADEYVRRGNVDWLEVPLDGGEDGLQQRQQDETILIQHKFGLRP
jgi:hypothetical protein